MQDVYFLAVYWLIRAGNGTQEDALNINTSRNVERVRECVVDTTAAMHIEKHLITHHGYKHAMN